MHTCPHSSLEQISPAVMFFSAMEILWCKSIRIFPHPMHEALWDIYHGSCVVVTALVGCCVVVGYVRGAGEKPVVH